MPRIAPATGSAIPAKSVETLASIKGALGGTPNIFTTVAHSPAALQALWGFFGAMGQTSLSAKLREQIALAVGESNQCGYCVAAHTAIGKSAGLNDGELNAARLGQSTDAKDAAALKFANSIIEKRGHVSDGEVAAVKAAGYDDAQVIEILAVTVQNIFTNYVNHVAQTAVDFPAAPALKR